MKYYSIAEQHTNGDWWYHPRLTFKSKKEAEEGFKTHFWWDLERPYKILVHSISFPIKKDLSSWYSADLKHWFGCFDDEPFELN